MASILEALEMAQQRNKERDVMNTERRMPILPIIPTGEVKPIVLDTGGGGGPDVYQQDTRTEQEKYNDLVASNKYAPMVPVVGTALGLLNDYQIEKMEKANPSLRPEDPFSAKARERFSYAGRVAGYGYPQQEGKYHTSLWDRITGYDPTYAESLARTNYPVPTNTRNYNNGGGDGGGDGNIGGYSRESLSFDNPSPSDDYGYA
jgi:hypothetical protein